ncbi:hypothetical protein ACEQ8H_002405 [Pleosporales sp. CAS-2024a]
MADTQTLPWDPAEFPCTLHLSLLVRRSFSVRDNILHVIYAATTNRMLRVAVNGFIESVGVVVGAMKDLDVDVVYEPVSEGLEGVQGLVKG